MVRPLALIAAATMSSPTHRHRVMTKHILIIAPAWVGDMVMAQTLFKQLKQRGDCQIDVVAPKATLALAERMPEIDKTYLLDVAHGGMQWQTRCKLAQRLRRQRYDQAIVLPNSWKSGLLAFLAKIPQRTGWRGEWRYGLLNDVRYLDKKRYPLMIERFCALSIDKQSSLPSRLTWPSLQTKPSQVQALRQQLHLNDEQKPILAICPGAEFGPSKRWPVDYFANIAQQKIEQGWQVWLFGSPKDADLGQAIQQQTEQACHNLIGQTTLAQAVDLLSAVTVVVSNDSGLMHISAALDKPVIVLYGSTDPGFTPPLSDKARILQLPLPCSPCFQRTCPLTHHHCLTKLMPAQVLQAIDDLVA